MIQLSGKGHCGMMPGGTAWLGIQERCVDHPSLSVHALILGSLLQGRCCSSRGLAPIEGGRDVFRYPNFRFDKKRPRDAAPCLGRCSVRNWKTKRLRPSHYQIVPVRYAFSSRSGKSFTPMYPVRSGNILKTCGTSHVRPTAGQTSFSNKIATLIALISS